MKKIEFTKERDSKTIIGMHSSEGEYVKWTGPVMAVGAVEHWLTYIEKMMCQSLYDETREALYRYPENGIERADWLFTAPA